MVDDIVFIDCDKDQPNRATFPCNVHLFLRIVHGPKSELCIFVAPPGDLSLMVKEGSLAI